MVAVTKSAKVILIVSFSIVGVILGLYLSGAWGSLFQPPPPAPEEYQVGFAKLEFRDPYTMEPLSDVEISIQFYNGTIYLNVTAGEIFYVPEASWFFARKPSYWNVSGPVYAQGETPAEAYVNTFSMTRVAPKFAVEFRILAIDGNYGTYTSADIPDGYHEVRFIYQLTGEWYNTSTWGSACYVPDFLVPAGSLADQLNVSRWGLWLGWNGTISDFSLLGSPVSAYKIFDVGTYNATIMYPFAFSGEFTISATFSQIQNATLYLGFLHETDHFTIPF